MNHSYTPKTGILTFELSKEENRTLHMGVNPTGPMAGPGVTMLRIMEYEKNRMIEMYGKCEVEIRVAP